MIKNKILNAIKEKFGIEEIDLVKVQGTWYWTGEVTSSWEESCTYYTTLKNCKLSDWVQDFEEKYNKNF